MTDIKLIAIDLDDTLLHDDLTISARAKKDIQEVVDKGVTVTLATGRMFAAALPFGKELGLNVPLITYQGGMVKYLDGRIVSHQKIPQDMAQSVIDFLHPYGYHINVYVNDELFMERDSSEGRRYVAMTKVSPHYVDSFERLWDEPTKLVIIADDKQLEELTQPLEQRFGDRLKITKTLAHLLEVTHRKATKGVALKALAESLSLGFENVMAIGDSLNDIEMIEYAGFGVAMENAVPQLKEKANYITCSNNADGVAEVLERFILTK
ncbi:MAG: Cof-type HAD-IIB family hydrolase [Clostridia bacterium]|nr:Cof-type HAD-IIB family hydrolase [Clostridia bacterium]MDD4047541.1 Cof-type HAD-IIB family hydrolase [Clostridia bacterium]